MLRRAAVSRTCAYFLAVFLAGGALAQSKPSSDLLLPYFEVGLAEGGTTTVLLVSNSLNKPVDVLAEVYSNWGVEVLEVRLRLKARELWTADLREWLVHGRLPGRTLNAADLLHYQAALSGDRSPRDGLYYSAEALPGFGVGAVKLRTLGERPDALQGQYLVNNGQGSTQTLTLSNLDSAASPVEVCNRHSVRHKLGRGLGPSQVLLWTDMADQALQSPDPEDRRLPVNVSVFSDAGELLKRHTVKLLPAARIAVADLGLTSAKGRVEITTGNRSVVGVRPSGNAVFETLCGAAAPSGNQPKVEIVTLINDQDANSPPGPSYEIGAPLVWKYRVTNAGVGNLTKVRVVDQPGGKVSCPQSTLKPGQIMTCTRRGVAKECQQKNVGKVTAAAGRGTVTAQDPSHYRGGDGAALEVQLLTNDQAADDPATAPRVPVGSRLLWSYRVTNTGRVRLFDIRVTDEKGAAVPCPKTSLAPGEPMTCRAEAAAAAGQQRREWTVTAGTTTACGPLTVKDASYYFGEDGAGTVTDTGIQLRVRVNGYDADFPPGPSVSSDGTVTWEYLVANSGGAALSGLQVTDRRDGRDVSVPCPAASLQPGESMTCTARGAAEACQHSGAATATGQTSQGPVTATDMSHYFGESPASIRIEAAVNGADADQAPGPAVSIGTPVQWTYVVTNTGRVGLTGIRVTDDRAVRVDCGERTELRPGESMSCTGAGTAVSGSYRSLASVTAQPPCGAAVSDDDPTHYLGSGDPGLRIQVLTNGEDADVPTGPFIGVGEAVTWSYVVTNTGQLVLSDVQVTDSESAAVSCPKMSLQPGEVMTCTAKGVAQACQYSNMGTVTARTPTGQQITAADLSHYIGQADARLVIETTVNGEEADTAPGPTVSAGSEVKWIFAVANTGDVALSGVTVANEKNLPVFCPQAMLQPGESMSCFASGTAEAGQVRNNGTVTATPPCGSPISAQDPSYYFGGEEGIELRKYTNGQDANESPGPSIAAGSPVTWAYVVSNVGTVAVSRLSVTDDRGVQVTCPATQIDPGQSVTCTGTGTAQACGYSNTGTATVQSATGLTLRAVDPSHYTGEIEPGVALAVSVNGQPASQGTGPTIPIGSALTWTFLVTNTGDAALSGIAVADELHAAGEISCPRTILQPAEAMTCFAFGTAVEGAVRNTASVTATPPCGAGAVGDEATGQYTGSGTPALLLRKLTNDQDVSQAPGPSLTAGSPVTWKYVVTNAGQTTLSNVRVTDDRGVVVTCPSATLAAGASMTCTGSGVAQACQYANVGTATGQTVTGELVSASDTSFYFGQLQASVQLETSANGNTADTPPGPTAPLGSQVRLTYQVTNNSSVTLSNVTVSDSRGAAVLCPRSTLAAGEVMTCAANVTAQEGQVQHVGAVTADPPCGDAVSAQDAAYYLGAGSAGLRLLKLTNGKNDDLGPINVTQGTAITWSYIATNTGTVELQGLVVGDDKGVQVTCEDQDLKAGESVTCTGTGTAGICGYQNTGIATAVPLGGGSPVTATDSSSYFGNPNAAFQITMSANGQAGDASPGPLFAEKAVLSFSYTVTNSGAVTLTGVRVDSVDVLTGTAVQASCPKTTLAVNESMTCGASVTATVGSHRFVSTPRGTTPCGNQIAGATPDDTYFVVEAPRISLQKAVANGLEGATITTGNPVSWNYTITNTGSFPLTSVAVTDNRGVAVTCPAFPTGGLQPGQSVTCTGSGTALCEDYTNVGTATAFISTGASATATDSSSYRGTRNASVSIQAGLENCFFVCSYIYDDGAIVLGGFADAHYRVVNTGDVTFTNVRVYLAEVTGERLVCVKPTLTPGEVFLCTLENDPYILPGLRTNHGIVRADSLCTGTVQMEDTINFLIP